MRAIQITACALFACACVYYAIALHDATYLLGIPLAGAVGAGILTAD